MSDSPQLQVSVRPLFATPLVSVLLPDAEAINARLSRTILERRTKFGGVQASNVGGSWHSDRDMGAWGGEDVQTIIKLAMSLATRATAKRRPEFPDPAWALESCWANVNGFGHANMAHYHPGAFWSAVYYVDDGGCSEVYQFGGAIEFLNPRGASSDAYIHTATGGDPYLQREDVLRPKSGMLLLFPSTLYHQVREYRGDRTRISISFNLRRVDAPNRRVFGPRLGREDVANAV